MGGVGFTILAGYAQAGSGQPARLVVVSRGDRVPASISVRASSSSGYAFERALRPRDTPPALCRALRAQGVGVYLVELPAPGDDRAIEVDVSSGGDRASYTLRPMPAACPADGLSFVLGSCLYAYLPERSASLASALASERDAGARFALYLGDNVYCDVHPMGVGPDAFAHVARIYAHAFGDGRASAGALAALPTMLAFDDHDFYDGYPETQPHVARTWLSSARERHVQAAAEGIALFQAPLNPTPMVSGGRSYAFDLAPLSFFVLDLRTSRTRLDVPTPRLTTDDELAAFEAWTRGLTAPGVLALEQPLYLEDGTFHEPSPAAFQRQFDRILRALRDAPFDVLVLAGDLHWSQVVELDVGGRRVHEVTSSPLVRIPSFPRNMLARLIGTPDDQEPQQVVIPKSVTRAPHACRVDVSSYVMGTSVANGFARLHARVLGGGRVRVDVDFFDHAARRVADCEPDRGRGMAPRVAIGDPCRASIELGPLRGPGG